MQNVEKFFTKTDNNGNDDNFDNDNNNGGHTAVIYLVVKWQLHSEWKKQQKQLEQVHKRCLCVCNVLIKMLYTHT